MLGSNLIKATQQVILASQEKFIQKYINRDPRFFNNEESVKSLFERQVEFDLTLAFPQSQIIIVPNHQINFNKGVIKSFVSTGIKNDQKFLNEGAFITQTPNGPIINNLNKVTKSEHIDTLIYIKYPNNVEYSIAVEFKHRNLLNSKGQKEGREFQESEAIIKDLERLTALMDPTNYTTDSNLIFNDFMFCFITDHKQGFVDRRIRTSKGHGYTLEFGEGVVKEFNGYKFNFKYNKVQNSYFLNFDSF